jgi:hypothetical protein
VEIRFRKGAENQGRHGDLEDEVAQDLSCVCPEEASSHGQPADQDENENRGDIRGNGRHGGKAFAAFAGGYSALEPFRPEWNRENASCSGFNRGMEGWAAFPPRLPGGRPAHAMVTSA